MDSKTLPTQPLVQAIQTALRPLFLLGLAAFASAISRGQTVGINLTAATLYDNTNTPLVDGSLVQLIVSPTDVFSDPTNTSFVSGDNVVIASFGIDSSTISATPNAGGFSTALTIDLSAYPTLSAGDAVLLRWYDTPYDPNQSGPGSALYGQFTTTGTPDGSDPWVLGTDGSNTTLSFLTESNEGSQLESAGVASMSPDFSAVPEPSTYALICGFAALGFAVYRRRAAGVVARS